MIKIYPKTEINPAHTLCKELIQKLRVEWSKKPGNKNIQKIRAQKEKPLSDLQKKFLEMDCISDFLEYVNQMSDEQLSMLLTIPIYQMESQAPECYQKLQPYHEFCQWYIRSLQGLSTAGRSIKVRRQILEKCKETSCQELTEWIRCFEELWKISPALIAPAEYPVKIREALDAINQVIGVKYDYDLIPTEIRRALARELDISVCPYCNQNYVYSLSRDYTETKQYLGDLDHILPKSIYRLYSLSFWNLILVCKTCNQSFKGADIKALLNPRQEGFEEDCHLEVQWKEGLTVDMITGMQADKEIPVEWIIRARSQSEFSKEKQGRIRNSIDTFQLNDQYNKQQSVIRDTLWKRNKYKDSSLQELMSMWNQPGMQDLSQDEYNRFCYGVSLNPEKDQHEVHGKMIRDLIQTRPEEEDNI